MRVASFNILHGRALSDQRVDLDRLAEAIMFWIPTSLRCRRWTGCSRDLTELTSRPAAEAWEQSLPLRSRPVRHAGCNLDGRDGGRCPWRCFGIALLSRYPARSWQVLRLPQIRRRFPMWLPGPRKIILTNEEPRAVVIGDLETPGGQLVVANTHLSFVPGWGRLQIRRISRDLAAVPSPVMEHGASETCAADGLPPTGVHPTFPAAAPTRQLDHILLRGDLGRVDREQRAGDAAVGSPSARRRYR